MTDIWFISDTHFFHDNIIRFCGRPFANSDLMNECLIDNWNSVVKPGDKVYHLGDVALGVSSAGRDMEDVPRLFRSLNGRKRLIVGNHDNLKSPALQNNFDKIELWNGFHSAGVAFTCSHIPLPLEHLRDGKHCVHGHIHNQEIANPAYINVCVEHTGYTPIHMDVIVERIKNNNT